MEFDVALLVRLTVSGLVPSSQTPILVKRDIAAIDIGIIPEGLDTANDLDRFSKDRFDLGLSHSNFEPAPVFLILPITFIRNLLFSGVVEARLQLFYPALKFRNLLPKLRDLVLLGMEGLSGKEE